MKLTHEICETEVEGGGFAIRPRRDGGLGVGLGLVQWFDLTHARAFVVRLVLTDTAEEYAFEDMQGRRHTLRPLTLEGYRERLQPRMGGPDLDTLEAVEQLVRDVLSGP